jgi:hypothetical protein
MSQPPEDHLKALWQGQETETPTMTAVAIRALARNYVDNARGRIWLGVGLAAFELVGFGRMAWLARNEVVRAGYLVILAGVLWLTWRIVRRRPLPVPTTEASALTLIEFHRAQLERQQSGFSWVVVSAAPIFVGIAITMVGLHQVRPNLSWRNIAPTVILSIAWFVASFVIQRRQARRLAEQIAEMDDLAGR